MDNRTGWRYFTFFILIVILVVIAGDTLLRNSLSGQPEILREIRPNLALGGLILIALGSLIFLIAQQRIIRPLDHLVRNLKVHIGGSDLKIDALHNPGDISPLLYTLEVLLNSYALQIQDAEAGQETLRSVLNQITDGIVMVDEDGTVNSMNPAAEMIFETSSEDARGHTVAEVLRHHQWIELYRSCLESRQEKTATLEIPSRKEFLQGIAIPAGENLPGYTLMVFQDLSRIRRLETTRQDFISNISHELRTPLASLKALTDTLQEGALDDPEAAKRFLSRMDKEVDALSQMVSELLELSQIESGRVPLVRRIITPHQLLQEAHKRMNAQAARRNLGIEIKASEELPPVEVDARRVEQVLVNLLHNAIKFSDPGDQILLSAFQEEEGITFCVEDFGIGISEADLERIFERFYKTEQARSSGGTGLGLSIAKHIVEAHQGRIWAESTLNQGSRFFFWIPLVPEGDQ